MADAGVQIKKKRTFKKYTYRGVDLDQLLAIKVFSVYKSITAKGSPETLARTFLIPHCGTHKLNYHKKCLTR